MFREGLFGFAVGEIDFSPGFGRVDVGRYFDGEVIDFFVFVVPGAEVDDFSFVVCGEGVVVVFFMFFLCPGSREVFDFHEDFQGLFEFYFFVAELVDLVFAVGQGGVVEG